MSLQVIMTTLTALLLFLAGLFGAFLGAYTRRKAQNLATKEDIARITTLTEEIRSNLATKAWQSQRWWDEKKAIYSELIRGLSRIADGLWTILHYGFDPKTSSRVPDQVAEEAAKSTLKEIDAYLQYTGVAFVFLSPSAHQTMKLWAATSKTLHERLLKEGSEFEYFRDLKIATDSAYDKMIAAAKADLKGE